MNFNRWFLAAVFFVILFAQMLLYPDISGLAEAVGLSPDIADSSLFILAEYIPFMLAALFFGAYSDKIGDRNRLLGFCSVTAGIGYLALGVLPFLELSSLVLFFIIRAWQGFFVAGAFVMAFTKFLDFKGDTGRNMGMAGLGIGLAPAFGFPVGGALYSVSVAAPLIFSSILFFVVGAVSVLFRNRIDLTADSVADSISSLKRIPEVAIPYGFHYIDRVTGGFIALGGTFYLREVVGLTAGQVGGFLMLFFVPYALLMPFFGGRSTKDNRLKYLIAGSVLYGLGIAMVSLVSTVPAAAAVFIFAAVAGAVMVPASLALVGDYSSEINKGTLIGGLNVAGSLGYISGTAAAGVLSAVLGYGTAFVVFGSLQIAAASLLALYLFIK